MIYLAVSDILVSAINILGVYVFASDKIFYQETYWKQLCIIKDFFVSTVSVWSVLSYMLLSVDRYFIFSSSSNHTDL